MHKLTRGKIKGFLTKYSTDKQVLDIGAGNTEYTDIFPNRTRVDIDPERKPDIVADIVNLPFKDGSYEVIMCSEIFEHLLEPQKAIEEIKRVLKPGGILILTTRFLFPIHDAPGDYWRYTPYSLAFLFRDWHIVEIQMESDVFSTIGVLIQRIIFQTDVRGGRFTKVILHVISIIFSKLDWLILKRYGDIKRTTVVNTTFSSGIYGVFRKQEY